MKLEKVLQGIEYQIIYGTDNIEINKIEYDSRNVKPGDMFVCIEGYSTDGHKYIKNAIASGAVAIICQKIPEGPLSYNIIKVNDSRKALAICGANYFDRPSDKMKIIGITGTNGKTTSTFMIKAILESAGHKVGLVGTIANYIGDLKIVSHRTTPESLDLQKLFCDMVDAGCDFCIMEVSSHSLYLSRVYGVWFSQAIFTNLTRDHLDFHKTFENYYNAKLILFKNTQSSVINIDDEYGERVLQDVTGKKLTYSINKKSDVKASNIKMHARGAEFDLNFKGSSALIHINIPGKYNIANALSSAGACLAEGLTLTDVKEGLGNMKNVPGRCELITCASQLGFEMIVDYAHTPDGLSNILSTAREFTSSRLISVFGCGGDRDKTKRPIMGKIGTELSDIAIITSDNPRTEDPAQIIKDVVAGCIKDNFIIIENRREAIKKAMQIALDGDVIVVAGKGHEDYQILRDKTIHFDEREIIAELVDEIKDNE